MKKRDYAPGTAFAMLMAYVVWSSKISRKSVKFRFHFSNLLYAPLSPLHFAENPIEIGQLVPKIQAVEGCKKQKETKTFSALFGSILKSIFTTSDWFCLIASHIIICVCCFPYIDHYHACVPVFTWEWQSSLFAFSKYFLLP